jgi:bifunctional enzyme CysN/CysC
MIIDRLDPKDLPTRITPESMEKIERGQGLIQSSEYVRRYNQQGSTIWITGLHGSGKNNLAYSLEKKLFDEGATVVLIDGFTIRSGLSRELDFSPADRTEHLRRVAHICRILNSQGIMTICSFISPNEDVRKQVAGIIGPGRFHLVYMNSDLDYARNFKPELYEKYEQGKISGLPGMDIPYEVPEKADVVCSPEGDGLNQISAYLAANKIFPAT